MGDKDQASLYISAKVSYVYHLSATTFIAPDFAGNELDIYIFQWTASDSPYFLHHPLQMCPVA